MTTPVHTHQLMRNEQNELSTKQLNWKFKSDGNSEWARFEAGNVKVHVEDQDGDMAFWDVKVDGRIYEKGVVEEMVDEKYIFDVALELATIAFYKAWGDRKLPKVPRTFILEYAGEIFGNPLRIAPVPELERLDARSDQW